MPRDHTRRAKPISELAGQSSDNGGGNSATARHSAAQLKMTSHNAGHHKDSVKTYIEQTKVLISLASAFVVAPAAAVVLISSANLTLFLVSEGAFVLSVLCGYVVFSTISGQQFKNNYNVYNCLTRCASWLQLVAFLAGLGVFCWMIFDAGSAEDDGQPTIQPDSFQIETIQVDSLEIDELQVGFNPPVSVQTPTHHNGPAASIHPEQDSIPTQTTCDQKKYETE